MTEQDAAGQKKALEQAYSLSGRAALVTGAARGIGLRIAQVLGAAGARVAICDLPDSADESLAQIPGEPCYFQCDVTDRDAVQRTVQGASERLGGLHILVNNAGIALDNLLLRTKPEEWDKVLQVNLTGAFNFCKAAARTLLKAKEHGRIVSIASVVGERGNVGQISYSASKAGLLGMTKTLAAELGGRGITVNAIAPGFIETQMTAQHVSEQNRERMLSEIPLGRMGSVDDVAHAVHFLCTPAAGYITGAVIKVNGGLYT